MSNGNVFKEIKEVVLEKGEKIPADVRDRLILSGLIEIYERIECIEELQRFKATAEKIFWLVISPLFLALGTGLILVIAHVIE